MKPRTRNFTFDMRSCDSKALTQLEAYSPASCWSGEGGDLVQVTRSARELLAEPDQELKIGEMLKVCMLDGAS
jgi:hypothetical protein